MNRRELLKSLGVGLLAANLRLGMPTAIALPSPDMDYAVWMDYLIEQCMAQFRVTPEEMHAALTASPAVHKDVGQ